MSLNLENPQKRISKDTFDRLDYGILTENFHFSQISNLISKTKLSCNINNVTNQISNVFNTPLKSLKLFSNFDSNISAIQNQNIEKTYRQKNALIHPSQSLQSLFIFLTYAIRPILYVS